MALRPGDGRRHAHILHGAKAMVVIAEVELRPIRYPLAGLNDLLAVLSRIAVKQLVACLSETDQRDGPHQIISMRSVWRIGMLKVSAARQPETESECCDFVDGRGLPTGGS